MIAPAGHSAVDALITEEPEFVLRWTVKEFHHLAQANILDPDKRTELIAGQILLMAAKGTPHVIALALLADLLKTLLGLQALVRTQDPVQLDDYSEPEPDLAIVRGGLLDYLEHHPQPSDVLFIAEVADSTLKRDCEVKDKVYAQAGIPDYWVLDVKKRKLHIYREPTPSGYAYHLVCSEPSEVALLAFPEITVQLSDILPPKS
jgi:Uma2 family endonuclease